MKKSVLCGIIPLMIALMPMYAVVAHAQTKWVTPFTNEISFYKNLDDLGHSRGNTLQIISINGFDVGTDIILEFTGDFNWDMDPVNARDYYIELSLVKPIYKSFSINYQRIYGTYYDPPVNQFGIRFSLFTGS